MLSGKIVGFAQYLVLKKEREEREKLYNEEAK